MRPLRLALLLSLGVAVGLLAPGVSSATPAEPTERDARASGCDGPCPTLFFFTGNGRGRIYNASPEPAYPEGSIVNCHSSQGSCDAGIPDFWAAVVIKAQLEQGSRLKTWKGCSNITSSGDCELWVTQASGFVVCPVFELTNAPVPDSPCPPPTPIPPSPPAPPPPPPGPPPVGARCTIPGSARGDVIRGTPANDVICGRGGNDVIYGSGGNDLLVGGSGADKLYGQGGRDRIHGGSGRDLLSGAAAEDELLARDRTRDTVSGGPGRDRARVDRADRLVSIERRF